MRRVALALLVVVVALRPCHGFAVARPRRATKQQSSSSLLPGATTLHAAPDDDNDSSADADAPFAFEESQRERDTLIPALTLLSIAVLVGTYAAETLRLMAAGEFYVPHFL